MVVNVKMSLCSLPEKKKRPIPQTTSTRKASYLRHLLPQNTVTQTRIHTDTYRQTDGQVHARTHTHTHTHTHPSDNTMAICMHNQADRAKMAAPRMCQKSQCISGGVYPEKTAGGVAPVWRAALSITRISDRVPNGEETLPRSLSIVNTATALASSPSLRLSLPRHRLYLYKNRNFR